MTASAGEDRRAAAREAARWHERAGLLEAAAHWRDRAGEPAAAARLWEQTGTREGLRAAAARYRAAARFADAARCWQRLGRTDEAVGMWLAVEEFLAAGWLLLRADRTAQARGCLRMEPGIEPVREVRRELGLALSQRARVDGRIADAVAVLGSGAVPAEAEALEQDAVFAADRTGRPDLAGEVFAASFRGAVPGAAARWRTWAAARGLAPLSVAGLA